MVFVQQLLDSWTLVFTNLPNAYSYSMCARRREQKKTVDGRKLNESMSD